jgi:hypothetical protein
MVAAQPESHTVLLCLGCSQVACRSWANYWITNKSVCLYSAFIGDRFVGILQGLAVMAVGLCPNAGIAQHLERLPKIITGF